jgi:hypothetical protein
MGAARPVTFEVHGPLFFRGSDASQRRESLSRRFNAVRGRQCKGKLRAQSSLQYCGT